MIYANRDLHRDLELGLELGLEMREMCDPEDTPCSIPYDDVSSPIENIV